MHRREPAGVGVQADLNERTTPDAGSLSQWAVSAANDRAWDEAASRWALVRKLYPQHAPGWVQGAIAERELKNYAQSEALLEHAKQAFPGNPNVLLQWAELHIVEQQADLALEKLRTVVDAFPDDMVGYARLTDVLATLGRFDEAAKVNQRVRELFPDRPRGWQQYAELAMQQERWAEALTRWSMMRERFANHAAGYMRAAVAAENLGDRRLAKTLRLAREYGNAWLESTLGGDSRATAHRVNPPQRRGMLQFIELVWTKARLNLKSEANQNYLRYLWWIIDPLLYMAVFYVVFGLLLNRGGDNFVVYLLSGLVPFQWFAKTVQLASGSIIAGSGLMHQVRISPMFFPLVMIVQTAGKQLLVFGMLFLFLMLYGLYPGWHWVGLVPVIVTQLVLTVVVSAVVAMIIPFARDIANLIPTGLQFVMFMSAVFYNTDIVPDRWRTVFFLNPMATLLEQYRVVLLDQQWPVWSSLGWVMLGSGLTLLVLLAAYRRLAPIYPRVVLE